MKPLDSLALMLVLSSSPLTAVTAKDSIKQDIEQHSRVDASQLTESFTSKPNVKPLNIPDHMKKGNGTFRASELYWSEENNELYFKGKVRVNFNKQRFHGDGSFTFLGRIHLLVVDGQAITPGSTVKLDDRDYRLVTLDSKAAGEKYGDQGMYGAVEISRAR